MAIEAACWTRSITAAAPNGCCSVKVRHGKTAEQFHYVPTDETRGLVMHECTGPFDREFTRCVEHVYGANRRYHMQCESYAGHDGPCTLHPDPKGCPNA